MSSFLCFICHNTVDLDTNEVTREKYREVVGINLCPDSQLCYICHHMLNKLWMFRSICLKRSLEYPVLFREKGSVNLYRTEIKTIILCTDETCLPNSANQVYVENRDQSINSNDYFKLEDDHERVEEYLPDTGTENGKADLEIEIDVNKDEESKDFDDSNDSQLENYVKNDSVTESDNTFDNKELHSELEIKIERQNDDCDNYDEKSEYVLETNQESNVGSGTSKKKTKSKNSKKKDFEKIVLSLEEQKSELETQRRSKKYVEAEFKCYNCALGFLFKDTYQAHMMRHEESNGEHVCLLCALRFASGGVLRSHAAQHHTRYRCARCARQVTSRQLARHARSCGAEGAKATCHLCGRVFQDVSGLQQHLRRFHLTKTSNRTYACSVCGKNYNNQAAVRTHMIKHIHQKFSCDQCPSTFSSPYTLTQHKKKHSAADSAEHYCARCGRGYSSRKSLLAHLRTSANHQQRAFECPMCNRLCPTSRALSSHMSTVHSAHKPFRCVSCDARYSSRKSLVRHIRSHTSVTQHKLAVCHICGSSFKGKSKLNRHLREVCEKDKLEEELSTYYEQHVM